MRFGGILTAAVFGAMMGTSGAMAQSYSPEEIPPASFKGRQYVDSAGCVFVRAGYGNATKWVPRINRDRTAVCGFKPSLPAAQVATAAPAQVVAPKPVIAKAAPTSKVAAPVTRSYTPTRRAAKAPMATVASNMMPETGRSNSPYYPVKTLAPRAVAQAAATTPATTQRGYVSPYSMTGDQRMPAPPVTVARAAAPQRYRAPMQVASASVCADLDPVAQAYMQSSNGRTVRCGPQDAVFATAPRGQIAVAQPVVQQIPREVSVGGLASVVTTSPEPAGGWKPAFKDGRLNPYRGPRTQAGNAQMAQRWNTKTPMGLVPAPKQRVIYVPVARAGVSTKSVAPAATQTRQPVMSGKRFVQVGSFGVPSNAAGAKERLRALGLPVATGRSGGLTVIYAGPFAASSALQNALAQVRRAGFTDALLR
ncbi:SPOR domain-containing protein [Thioclava sp.]|uniref:SPOR domain-containing protein n=1 Tax=Thioclava sp. TaxID=1933450 RepID=UPI003AA7F2FB